MHCVWINKFNSVFAVVVSVNYSTADVYLVRNMLRACPILLLWVLESRWRASFSVCSLHTMTDCHLSSKRLLWKNRLWKTRWKDVKEGSDELISATGDASCRDAGDNVLKMDEFDRSQRKQNGQKATDRNEPLESQHQRRSFLIEQHNRTIALHNLESVVIILLCVVVLLCFHISRKKRTLEFVGRARTQRTSGNSCSGNTANEQEVTVERRSEPLPFSSCVSYM